MRGRNLVLVSASLIVVAGISADGWWHLTFGRDDFWIPPHITVFGAYTSILVTAIVTRDRTLSLIMVPLLLAGPADEFWHRTFLGGRPEDLLSLAAVWSPPHLWAELWTVALLALILRRLGRSSRLLATLQFAALTRMIAFPLSPLTPDSPVTIGGPLAFALAVTIFSVPLFAASTALRLGALTAISAIYLVFDFLFLIAPPTILLTSLDASWPWVVIGAVILGAGVADILYHRSPSEAMAMAAGAIRTLLTWVIYLPYANLVFSLNLAQVFIIAAIMLGTGGGVVGAYIGRRMAASFLGLLRPTVL